MKEIRWPPRVAVATGPCCCLWMPAATFSHPRAAAAAPPPLLLQGPGCAMPADPDLVSMLWLARCDPVETNAGGFRV